MKLSLGSCATLVALTTACTTTGTGAWPTATTPAAPSSGASSPAAPAALQLVGPGAHQGAGEWTVRVGDRVEGVLRANEQHTYLIDLPPGERLRWTIHGQSEAAGSPRSCTHWEWAWHEPGGKWMNGNPLPIGGYDRSEPREETSELIAQIPWSGDFKPLGGTWRYVLKADASCAEIQYWMTIASIPAGQ